MSNIIQVPFNGEHIDAVQDGDTVWVGVRRCCENLGLAYQPQHEKLRKVPWATITNIVTVADDGKPRPMTMLRADKLPQWLATINVNKVRAEIREKLAAYQCEAADVLAAYFTPEHAQVQPHVLERMNANSEALLDRFHALQGICERLMHQSVEREKIVLTMQDKICALESPTISSVDVFNLKGKMHCIADFVARNNGTSAKSERMLIENELRGRIGYERKKAHSWKNLPRDMFAKAWLELEAIKQVKEAEIGRRMKSDTMTDLQVHLWRKKGSN